MSQTTVRRALNGPLSGQVEGPWPIPADGASLSGSPFRKAGLHAARRHRDDRTDYFSSAELVAASQAIVVGRVVGERDETFNFRSAATGEVAAGLTEHVLTVEIASVLKGQVRAGDRIAVLQTSQNSTVSRTGGDTRNALEVLPLT